MKQYGLLQAGRLPRCSLIAALAAALSTQGHALSFDFDDGQWRLDLDTTLSYAAQWRVVGPDAHKYEFRSEDSVVEFTNKINGDDGTRNFDKGLVQNKISAVTELNLSGGDYGFFARARAYYDDVYADGTDHDERGYLTYNAARIYGGDADFQEFPDQTRDEHRSEVEFLDAFAYATLTLPGDRLFDIRVGRQVINWGEATFYQGINGLQNRIDTIAANTPGVEVKEILLPTGAVYAQLDLMPTVTFEAYFQYEWMKTDLNGVGSYYSDKDFLGSGATNFLIAFGADPETGDPTFVLPVPKTPDDRPSETGQYGLALHWVTEGGTDFGLYYVNAHSKAPSFRLNYAGIIPRSYTVSYFEDIQGYAASFTTVLGIINVQGEVSYKTDAPVVDENGDPDEGNIISMQLGGSHVLEPTAIWDDANLTFEVAAVNITSHDDDELRYDDLAVAAALRFEPSLLNVLPGLDLRFPIFLQHTLDGTIKEANMNDGATTFNVTVRGVYLNNFAVQVGYTTYLNGGMENLLTDRDNVSLSASYSF
jgi:hypothetical protein